MKLRVAAISILINIALAAIKIMAGVFSASAAILAEGIHSLVDVVSSLIGFIGIKISDKPADPKHPYGHFKYEVLSGVLITIILFATGLGIVWDAYKSWQHPGLIKLSWISYVVMFVSAVVNEILARYKISVGKKEDSLALLSDGYHSRVDVYSSAAVFAGLFLHRFWALSDALIALIIGLYIIKESFALGREAVDSLLDISAGPEVEDKIKEIIAKQKIELVSLKTQKKGLAITANLEIALDSNITVNEADKLSVGLRQALIDGVERLNYISIQIKSHDVDNTYYKPAYGRGFGWQHQIHDHEISEVAQHRGPAGVCICPRCGYAKPHQPGVPCSSLKCPKCGASLERRLDAQTPSF